MLQVQEPKSFELKFEMSFKNESELKLNKVTILENQITYYKTTNLHNILLYKMCVVPMLIFWV